MKFPAYNNIINAIQGGIDEDYHLVRLYYAWYSKSFYRKRLQLAADELKDIPATKLLEIGTGSGIFIPTLLDYADHVTGIDIHEKYDGLQRMLQAEGIDLSRVELKTGSILEIPYPDESFDVVVCMSVLEHFEDPHDALSEIGRVLRKGGHVITGFPAENAITGMLFKSLGYNAKEIHPGNHASILKGLNELFTVQKVKHFPVNPLPFYIVSRSVK